VFVQNLNTEPHAHLQVSSGLPFPHRTLLRVCEGERLSTEIFSQLLFDMSRLSLRAACFVFYTLHIPHSWGKTL